MFNLFEHVFRPKDMDAYQKDLDRAKQSVTETKDLEDEEQGASMATIWKSTAGGALA